MKIKLPDFHIGNVVQSLSEIHGWGLTQSKIPETWQTTKGEGVVIYVIDTGMPNHTDLQGNLIGCINFVPNESPADSHGHQTAVCGIIAAREDGQGMIGVAPEAKIFAIKALNKNGVGEIPSVYQALHFVVKTLSGEETKIPKPHIICMSLGSPDPFPEFVHDLIKKIYSYNVTIVCAAGNSGKRGVDFPAAYPECLAIGAYDESGNITQFSGTGPQVDFAGPGQKVYTTWLNHGYKDVRGTSFAAPFVCGIIALMISKHLKQEKLTGKNDCKTPYQVKQHLVKYSKDAGQSGKDSNFGYGIIDVSKIHEDPTSLPEVPAKEPPKRKKWWKQLLGI